MRITVFGNYCVSAKIINSNPEIIDWKDSKTSYSVTEFKAPSSIEIKCKRFMELMNLEFGAFDFIVKDDNWFFLEVNQMGQFLWIEDMNPKIKILQTFCRYLSGDNNFEVNYADVVHESSIIYKSQMAILSEMGVDIESYQ